MEIWYFTTVLIGIMESCPNILGFFYLHVAGNMFESKMVLELCGGKFNLILLLVTV